MMARKKIDKPYFRTKGRYADSRKRLCIEREINGRIVNFALPTPEELIRILRLVYGQEKKMRDYEEKVRRLLDGGKA